MNKRMNKSVFGYGISQSDAEQDAVSRIFFESEQPVEEVCVTSSAKMGRFPGAVRDTSLSSVINDTTVYHQDWATPSEYWIWKYHFDVIVRYK